ncbi:hypothetical protein Acr_28g0013460 [Actinidia rufa]|uniref:Uncharacterized protein n=1 Tax=Actinidia rufa TaxID=165716 RepID=A0A7J0HCD9_9ERIC|nr:hypothetical protein Acr_28g0013460 [Actinidia rufa]
MVGLLLVSLLLHILPGISCLSRDESSFGLSYNGGKIMTEPVAVSLIWFGTDWEKSGQEVIRNGISSLSPSRYGFEGSEVPTLGSWWNIIRQYTNISNAPVTDEVDVGAECFYVGSQLNMTMDRADWNRGNFAVEVFAGVNVTMAWARAPQKPSDQCSTFFRGDHYLGPPNGDEKIDSLVGYVLGNIAEEVTNRDGRGWKGNDGSDWTVSSYCGSVFEEERGDPPLFMDVERNVSFNAAGLNGYRYILQYVWDQNIKNCAMKPSETCGNNALAFKQPEGHLRVGIIANHTTGLQPYPPNQKCRWKIQYPTAKFISFTINYLSFAADSNDQLVICQSDSGPAQCSIFQSNDERYKKSFKIKGSKAYVEFTSGELVSFDSRGWELTYSAGLCSGKEDVYDRKGVIGYSPSDGYSYTKGLSCQWILHGKAGTPVTLSFSHINISKDFDFLAIYNGTTHQITNFSGIYSSSDLPVLNLTGEIMIEFATQTDKGDGWSANFYMSSPVEQKKKRLLIVIVVVLGGVLIGFSLALFTLALVRSRKDTNRTELDSQVEFDSRSILMRAEVNGEESRICEGSSSIVYRGISTDGKFIALKSPKHPTFGIKLEEEILLKTSLHPNIISLVGYVEDGIRGRNLVFEFMDGGSLSWNLRERGEVLDWERRLEIAVQISSAIQMLHMYLKPRICHRNITSENVLLDENYNAKLGGFGAAKYCTIDEMPSEMGGDIWSFGLLLVELLTGKPVINRNASEFCERFEVVDEAVRGQDCLDRRLVIPREECEKMGLAKLGEIAKWCIGRGENGPKIGDVVLGLKQVKLLFCSVPS